jgi:hypothetical protein
MLREVGVRVLGQHARPARRHVHRDERGLVAPARIEEVERLAVVAEIEQAGGVDLADRDRQEEHPGAARTPLEHLDVSGGKIPGGQPQLERAVGREPRELVVLVDERRLAGHDIDAIEVGEPLVALVVREEHLAREAPAHLVHPRANPARRRERHDRAVADVDARAPPVLVAAALLEEHDVAIRVRPLAERGDRSFGHARHGPAGAEIADGRDPKVPDAVDRRDVRDRRAVERQVGRGDVGIAEEGLARHEGPRAFLCEGARGSGQEQPEARTG